VHIVRRIRLGDYKDWTSPTWQKCRYVR